VFYLLMNHKETKVSDFTLKTTDQLSGVAARRMARLENTSEKTARTLLRDSTVTVQVGGLGASWNPKERILKVPAFSVEAIEDGDDPRLPFAFRGTLDHECAHVVHTDDALLDDHKADWETRFGPDAVARIHMIWNAYEDGWIEAAWATKRVGSRRHFRAMNSYTIEKTGGAQATDPTFVPERLGQPIGAFMAFVQALVRVGKGGIRLDEVHPRTRALVVMLRKPINAGWAARSTDDACKAAAATWEALVDAAQDQGDGDDGDGESGDAQVMEIPMPPSDGDGEQSSDDEQEPEGEPQGGGASDDDDADDEDDGEQDSDGSAGGDNQSDESEEADDGDDDDDGGSGESDNDGDDGGSDESGDDSGDSDGESDDTDGDGDSAGDGSSAADGDDGSGEPEINKAWDNHAKSLEKGPPPAKPFPEDEDRVAPQIVMGDEETNDDGDGEQSAPTGKAGGIGGGNPVEAAAKAVFGQFGEIPDAGTVIAGEYLRDPMRRPYTVHPDAQANDEVLTFDHKARVQGRSVLPWLKKAAGPAAAKLTANMRQAIMSSRQSLWVGGLEDGPEIDVAALPGIALGLNDTRIFSDTFRRLDESSYVQILVDLSGSMGDAEVLRVCSSHGPSKTKGDTCPKKNWDGRRCNKTLSATVNSKASYAQITALAVHNALRACRIPHGVCGHRNLGHLYTWGPDGYERDRSIVPPRNRSITTPNGDTFPEWSRCRSKLSMSEFVKAPGLGDDGAALPFITGGGANLDGEAVLWSAKYAVQNAGSADRVILLVISDGLPAGADDCAIEGVHLLRTVERVARAGVEVYGVGVGIRGNQFGLYYPHVGGSEERAATGHVMLDNAKGLTDRVLRDLTVLLSRSAGYVRTRRAV